MVLPLCDESLGLGDVKIVFFEYLKTKGWKECKRRYFDVRMMERKCKSSGAEIAGTGLECHCVSNVCVPGHFAWVVCERSSDGVTIFRYFDSMPNDNMSTYLRTLFQNTELWNHEDGRKFGRKFQCRGKQ